MSERVLVYRNPDDEQPLHVWATLDDDVVLLDQGPDRIAVPFEDWGRFVDALEGLYTQGFPAGAQPAGRAPQCEHGIRGDAPRCSRPSIGYERHGGDLREWYCADHMTADFVPWGTP